MSQCKHKATGSDAIRLTAKKKPCTAAKAYLGSPCHDCLIYLVKQSF